MIINTLLKIKDTKSIKNMGEFKRNTLYNGIGRGGQTTQ
jgi:hypothetical protein